MTRANEDKRARQRRRRGSVNRLWAVAVFFAMPVWIVLATSLIVTDRQLPRIDTVGAGVSKLTLDSSAGLGYPNFDDTSLYVTPESAVEETKCVIPSSVKDPDPINRTSPDRPATAERTVDGVTYYYFGRVYSMTSEISCDPGVTGLLLTAYDRDHQDRNFGIFILALCPVLGWVAVRILRGGNSVPPASTTKHSVLPPHPGISQRSW